MFELHSQLAQDCIEIGDLALSKVLLLNDSQFPWVILVPRKDGIEEVFSLNREDQNTLQQESSAVAAIMSEQFNADKMNIAALGNMVPQLHIHHIARFKTDVAWPKPVWGVVPATAYEQSTLDQRLQLLRQQLAPLGLVCC